MLFHFSWSKTYLYHNARVHHISVTLTEQLIFIWRETPCGLLVATEVEPSSFVWWPWSTSHCCWDPRQQKHSWQDTQYTVYPFMLIRWKLRLFNFAWFCCGAEFFLGLHFILFNSVQVCFVLFFPSFITESSQGTYRIERVFSPRAITQATLARKTSS